MQVIASPLSSVTRTSGAFERVFRAVARAAEMRCDGVIDQTQTSSAASASSCSGLSRPFSSGISVSPVKQPMSTPTAVGSSTSRVAKTLPIVAPSP